MEGQAAHSDYFEAPLLTCRQCRESYSESDMVVPCDSTGKCWLKWWPEDEYPDWAQANTPPGWETAYEIAAMVNLVGEEAGLLQLSSFVAETGEDTLLVLQQISFLRSHINRLVNQKINSSSKG